jgi:MazG family protein
MSDAKRLIDIMARLRARPGGCAWDLEQTFETIAPYTIEEAYEVDDAIRRQDFAALRDELGDLLLQVVFHARMAEEEGRFDFADVVDAISDKLVRRHPNVFGDAVVESAAAQVDAWEKQKAEERRAKGETSVADGVPVGLPALLRAHKLIGRAARAGLAAPDVDTAASEVRAALPSARDREGIGRLLLACARLARSLGVDPEQALRGSVSELEGELRAREARAPGA